MKRVVLLVMLSLLLMPASLLAASLGEQEPPNSSDDGSADGESTSSSDDSQAEGESPADTAEGPADTAEGPADTAEGPADEQSPADSAEGQADDEASADTAEGQAEGEASADTAEGQAEGDWGDEEQAAAEEAIPPQDSAKGGAKSSCGSDCTKPCCARQRATTCTKVGTCSKGGKCPHGSRGKRGCGAHGHRHKLRLPAGITVSPIARVQVRATLFDQDDEEANDPVVYGDPGLREGISLRRVRVGIEASWNDILTFRVVGGWDNRYDALSSLPTYPTLQEALFRISHILPIEIEAGLGRVPFGRQAQASSAHLALVERSLASELMSPSREPLVALRGALGPKDNKVLPEGALRWAVALSNGDSPWSGDPNPSPRLSGRVALDLGKSWSDIETGRAASGFGLSVGGSINHNWGLEARTLTGGFDLGVQIWRINLQGELLLAAATPTFDTEGLPSLLSERSSMGWYAQLGLVILPGWLELAARVGGYDDNRALSDAGDRLDIGGGVNFFLFDGHFKAQLHYVHRAELSDGYATANDSLVLQLQAQL